MIASYVGFVTQRGLELILPESEHALRLMQLQLRRSRQGCACSVWFVLDSGIAELVGELVASDESRAAWAIVEQQARDGGVMRPDRLQLDEFMYIQ